MSRNPKAWLVAACVVASGAAFAAGGGNGNSGTGGGDAHAAATAAPTAGNEPASNATGSMTGPSSSTKHHYKKSKPKAGKPMTDTTNTPGADASSETKGQ